jgi:hypothetical protein
MKGMKHNNCERWKKKKESQRRGYKHKQKEVEYVRDGIVE